MLSREEVLRIAHLARLELTEEEIVSYQNRLGRVLDYINELKQLETPKDAFVKHVPKDAVAVREDAAVPFKDAAGILANAPLLEQGSFLLPTIVEFSA